MAVVGSGSNPGAKFYSNKITSPLLRECWGLENLIPVPSMKSGWSMSGTSSVAGYASGTYSIKLTGTASSYEACVNTTASIPLNHTHIYYARVYGKQNTACGSAGFYWPIAEPSLQDGIAIQAAGAWRMYSTRNHRSTFTDGSYQFRLDFNNNQVAGEMWYSCPMLLDLTASFGAGNEPTKEWCDANIPFFEGCCDIPLNGKPVSIFANELRTEKLIECLPNLICEGSFENTGVWSGTTYDTTQHKFGSKSSKLYTTTGTVLNSQSMPKPILNHIYYGRHYIKTDGNAAPADCRFEWFAGDGTGLNFVFGWNQGNHPDWFMESTRLKITAVNGTSYVCRNFAVAPNCNIWCDGLMIVDLTEGFGAGKEPSQTWCDQHLEFAGSDILITNIAIGPLGLYADTLEEN